MSVEGFLLKKGDKGIKPGWKRRWFQLQGNKITYKVSEKETKSIDLDKGSEVSPYPDEDPIYFLQADTQQERDYWIQEIQKAIENSDDSAYSKKIERKSSSKLSGVVGKVSSLRLRSNSTTQKIIRTTTADTVKLDKINVLIDDIDGLFRRDFQELTKALKKYQEISEALAEVGARVAEELVRMGNKYSETPYGTCFTEFGSDFKQMEEERKKLVTNGVRKFSEGSNQLDSELKNWEETKRKMREMNKKLDDHVKEQIDKSSSISNNSASVQAMNEVVNICAEVDSTRDQMIQQVIYERNHLLVRGIGAWNDFLIQQKAFSNIHKGYLDNSISKGTSTLEEAPKKPQLTWETFQPSSISFESGSPTSSSNSNSSSNYTTNSTSNSITNPNFFQQSSLQTEKQSTPTLPPGWESAITEEGYTYYYNTTTGESKWEFPT